MFFRWFLVGWALGTIIALVAVQHPYYILFPLTLGLSTGFATDFQRDLVQERVWVGYWSEEIRPMSRHESFGLGLLVSVIGFLVVIWSSVPGPQSYW